MAETVKRAAGDDFELRKKARGNDDTQADLDFLDPGNANATDARPDGVPATVLPPTAWHVVRGLPLT